MLRKRLYISLTVLDSLAMDLFCDAMIVDCVWRTLKYVGLSWEGLYTLFCQLQHCCINSLRSLQGVRPGIDLLFYIVIKLTFLSPNSFGSKEQLFTIFTFKELLYTIFTYKEQLLTKYTCQEWLFTIFTCQVRLFTKFTFKERLFTIFTYKERLFTKFTFKEWLFTKLTFKERLFTIVPKRNGCSLYLPVRNDCSLYLPIRKRLFTIFTYKEGLFNNKFWLLETGQQPILKLSMYTYI